MKSEQIKEITDKAAEQLIAALNAGRSEALNGYLSRIDRKEVSVARLATTYISSMLPASSC